MVELAWVVEPLVVASLPVVPVPAVVAFDPPIEVPVVVPEVLVLEFDE